MNMTEQSGGLDVLAKEASSWNWKPFNRNKNDERIGKAALEILSGLDGDNQSEWKAAQSLTNTLSGHYFSNSKVRKLVKEINIYLDIHRVAAKQEIDYDKLLTDAKDGESFKRVSAYTFMRTNHLHNKITQQHRNSGMKIVFENNAFKFPVYKGDDKTENLTLEELSAEFGVDLEQNLRVKNLEFLADGLEIHDAKNWTNISPLYHLTQATDGTLTHMNPHTGEEESFDGDVIQHFTVLPWSWTKIRGGGAFGHSSVKMVVGNNLYHVGGDLQGNILDPDFSATLNTKGKKLAYTKWSPLTKHDMEGEEVARTQAQRILDRVEIAQKMRKKETPGEGLQQADIDFCAKLIDSLDIIGCTCTSAASLVYAEATGDALINGRSGVARLIFNGYTNAALDGLYNLLPKFVVDYGIHPIQVITRGHKPAFVHDPRITISVGK